MTPVPRWTWALGNTRPDLCLGAHPLGEDLHIAAPSYITSMPSVLAIWSMDGLLRLANLGAANDLIAVNPTAVAARADAGRSGQT